MLILSFLCVKYIPVYHARLLQVFQLFEASIPLKFLYVTFVILPICINYLHPNI